MTTLDVPSLLGHPANGGVRRVCGPSADLTLQRIVLATDEQSLGDGAEAVAVLTSPPPPTSWGQDALLLRVRDRGYRVLAMPGASALGDGSREVAARIGIDVLEADDPVAIVRAGWELAEAQDALTLGYVRRVAQSIRFPAPNLVGLLRHLSSSLGHGVALVDLDGALVEAGGRLPATVHARIDHEPWTSTVQHDDGCAASVRVDSPSRSGLRLVVFDRALGLAQLTALTAAAEIAMPAVAARILIDEVADVGDAAIASGLLRELFERIDARDADLEQRMRERGWRTSGEHLGFRIVGRGRLAALDLLRLVQAELRALPAPAHAATSGRGVAGWLTFATSPRPEEVETAVAAIRALHGGLSRSVAIATGVGTLQSGVAGLQTTLEDAAEAARIATGRASTGHFVRLDALGIEQLLLSWTESDAFVPAAASLLAPLRDRAPELLATLATYLDHGSSVAATAEAMGLHRNTVSARIARTQDLLGLDLLDPETRLAAHLATRAVLRRAADA